MSDFAAAEFASSVSRRVRTRELTVLEARDAFADFDAWKVMRPELVESSPPDVRDAAIHMRRLDLPLRTPDAIHIAIAQRPRRHACDLRRADGALRAHARNAAVSSVNRPLLPPGMECGLPLA